MYRLFIGTCSLALLIVAGAGADDEKKAEKKASQPEAMFQELVGKYRAAKKEEDRQELLKSYAEKFLAYAKANPKADDAPQALSYIMQLPLRGGKDNPKTAALAILNKEHVKNPAIAKHLRSILQSGDKEAAKFARSVFEENPDKTARAHAAKALMKSREQVVQLAERLKDEDLRERFEKARGKNAVAEILEQAKTAEKEIAEYRSKLQGELKGVFPDLSVGAAAPEIVSRTLEGKEVKLSDLKGKVVVLDIWATWCPPCRAMIPHSRELVKKMEGKPFVFVSVSADAKKDTVTEFIKKNPMPWTHWFNGPTGGIIDAWEVEYFPTIYVLDHKGVIRFKDVRDKAMDRAVEKLVKEAEGNSKDKSE